tara:strand:- start:454 stop:1794 length:1341 start_codon:yes stop_codon:yes gene_type:complete
MKDLVSIYIVSKDYGRFAEQAIQSVLNQIYTSWELFLVNDNSKDNTLTIFKKYKAKSKKIKQIINLKKSNGLQKISNHILKICNGNFIIRLDADDWFNENALLVLVSKINSKKDYGIAYGGYNYVDENGTEIGLENNFDITKKNLNFPPHGACTLFKTRSLKEVGGYSTSITAQDGWDVWLKLKERVKFCSINLPLFYYRKHGQSLSDNYQRIIKERGKIIKSLGKNRGNYKLKILAVVPIKKDFIDKKNAPYIKYKNKNLIEHALRSINKSKYISSVAVSTTHKDIVSYIKKKVKKSDKDFLYYLRDKKYNKLMHSKIENLISETCNFYSLKNGYNPDIIVFLNLHVVMKDVSLIDKAINLLIENKKDSIFSVVKEKNPIFKFNTSEMKILNKGRFDNLDFNSEIIYKFNDSIIVSWFQIIIEKHLFDGNLGFLETEENDTIKIL